MIPQHRADGALFIVSFWLPLRKRPGMNENALLQLQTMSATLVDAEFSYESFQNWQSEFLLMAVLIYLR